MRSSFVLSLAAALTLAACAPKQPAQSITPEPTTGEEPAVPEPPRLDQAAIDDIHRRLESHRLAYAAGVELIVAGEEVLGEERIAGASNGLNDLTTECRNLPGCDLDRLFGVYEQLLFEQGLSLKTQTSRIQSLQTSIEEDVEREPGTSAFVAVMPEIGRSVSLLRGTDLREIISLNGPVRAALDDWLTWRRPLLMSSYENYQFLRDEMAPIYEEAGLPEALLFAMIATESGGKVHAFSRAGAAGPLQFMSYTGRRYGLGVVDGFDMRLDPAAATRANVAYLNDMFADLNDSLDKALAAYNGGENRMRGLHRRTGGASFWDSKVFYSLPRETREYVPRILAAAWLFLHPEDYNLELPRIDTGKVRLAVRQEISLGELTICLGQEQNPDGWFRTLRNLNPRFSPGERIEAGDEIVVPAVLASVYEERCLEGPLVETARVLHDANYPEQPEMIPYVVRRGDTLGRIASRNKCVSLRELAAINNIKPPRYVIRIGQRLKLPHC